MIGGLAGVELFEEPQAFLCEGQRQASGARCGVQSRQCAHMSGRVIQQRLSERGDAGRIERGAQGQLDREGLAQARDELSGEQRVTAEGEEVVEDADALEAEHAGKALGERVFERGARRDIGVEVLPLRIGQCTAIEFAVGG